MPPNRRSPPLPAAHIPHATPAHRRIAHRARFIWATRGRPRNSDLAIWLEAERQIIVHDDTPPRRIGSRLHARYRAYSRPHRSCTSL